MPTSNENSSLSSANEQTPESAVPESNKNSVRNKRSLGVMLLVLASAAAGAFAQEKTSGDSTTPLAYAVENMGANYPLPVFPTFEQLPIIRPLPDAFRFFDGTRNTAFSSWERRRNEIKAAIENYEIGPKPDCSDCAIDAAYAPDSNGGGGVLTVLVTRNNKSLRLTSHVYLPSGSGPFPALIAMSLAPSTTGPNYGSLPSSAFTGRPIATVDFVHDDVTQYAAGQQIDHSGDPFYLLYPELCAGTCTATLNNSGQYAAWSWGVSRIIDGLEIVAQQPVTPLPIDLKHLAVTGCSYAGKMALFAGAFDERVALTIAQENGGGGAPSWRVSHEIEANGAVEDLHDTDYSWFAHKMKQFAGDNGYKLPEDHHELMAMIAPRALLETGNTDFYWLSNRSNYISARATQQVYNTFGIGDRFGFYIDGGHAHCSTLPPEAPAVSAFVDKFMLGNATADTDVEVTPFPAFLDYSRWTAWWGSTNPEFPNNWNPGDGTVVLSMGNSLNINSGDSVLGGYDLSMLGDHPAATVSLAGGNVQTDISCPGGSSYTLTIPLPTQSYSIAADDNFWWPSADQNSPLVYQGSATATTCSEGVTTSAYFSALGVSSGAGNPGGPGFPTTDTADPLNVRFHCSDNGVSGSWSPTITVNYKPQPLAPNAILTASPTSGRAPLTVNFSGSGSSDPNAGGTITSYTFTFGDGSAPIAQSSPTITHSYTKKGTYTASLIVSDNYGSNSKAASVAVTVK
jgi:PKD repeat protein